MSDLENLDTDMILSDEHSDTKITKIQSENVNDEELEELNEKLKISPFNYSLHTELIDLLKYKNETSLLREARRNMSKIFPLTEELWVDWIDDEISNGEGNDFKNQILELFEKAVCDYQSVKIWLKYCQYRMDNIESKSDIDEIRLLFERSIEHAGVHFTEGSSIWEGYRDFEDNILRSLKTLHEDTNSEASIKILLEQKNRVLTIFRRQLSVPLSSLNDTKNAYDSWIVENEIDAHEISTVYETSLNKMHEIQPFEESISHYNSPRFSDYIRYIEYEINCNELKRAVCIFERAIKENCMSEKLWNKYINFLAEQKFEFSVINSAIKRAVRNIPTSVTIWIAFLRILEAHNQDPATIKECFKNALNSDFQSSQDVLSLRLHYGYYLIRLKYQNNDVVVKYFKDAIRDQTEQFGQTGDMEHKLLKCLSLVHQFVRKDLLEALECWKIIINSHLQSSSYWLEYLNVAKQFYDSKTLTELYKKCLLCKLDYPMPICEEFINFEIFTEDLDSVIAAEKLAEDAIGIYQKDKKIRYDEKNRKEFVLKPREFKNKEPEVQKIQKRKITTENDTLEKILVPKPEKVPKSSELPNEPKQLVPENIGMDRNLCVFISNIDFNCNEEQIKDIFSEIGNISNVFIMKNKQGQSKGYGFVQFNEKEFLELALKKDRKFRIGSRPVFISPVLERDKRQNNKFDTDNTNCLYISKIHPKVNEKELEDIFSKHKGFKQVRLATYHNGNSKGFAYISFDTAADVSAALIAEDGRILRNQPITIEISNPPTKKTAQFEKPDSRKSRTNIRIEPKTNENGEITPIAKMSNEDFRNLLKKKT